MFHEICILFRFGIDKRNIMVYNRNIVKSKSIQTQHFEYCVRFHRDNLVKFIIMETNANVNVNIIRKEIKKKTKNCSLSTKNKKKERRKKEMTEEKFITNLKNKLRETKYNAEMTADQIRANMVECAPVSRQNLVTLLSPSLVHVPKITTLKIICDALGITLSELFDDPMFNEQLTYVPEREVSRR